MRAIKEITVEYRQQPLGIDAKHPRFAWKLAANQGERSMHQSAYRILVRRHESGECVWDSGRVPSDRSAVVRYQGAALAGTQRYDVTLFVWAAWINEDRTKEAGELTGETYFETGFLDVAAEMKASWITHGFSDDLEPCAVFQKAFPVRAGLARARLYLSALGLYAFTVNGKEATDVKFAPGWTSYQERIQYQTYDLTEFLHPGAQNLLEVTVGNGWYKGILGFANQGCHYGRRTGMIAQLDLVYADGTKQQVLSDASWQSTTGPHRYSEYYHGETIDLTAVQNEVRPAALLDGQSKAVLTAQMDEPVRITKRIPGKARIQAPNGETLIDFGENIAGVVEAHIQALAGTRVVLHHGEKLDENGNLYTGNLRTARAEDVFVTDGGKDVFRPLFTSHGFRYISVAGLGSDINLADFIACAWHTDLRKTGTFATDNPKVNRLWENIVRTMENNSLDVATDCPQRDERLGYTGDAQMFLGTAVCIKNVELFYEKWLKDLKTDQAKNGGGVPTEVPDILGSGAGISQWHDAATIIPWTLYETYGDEKILENQFGSMAASVDYYKKFVSEDGLVHGGMQELGDWVAMDVPRGPWQKRTESVWNLGLSEKIGATDPFYIANIYYANGADLTARAARVLGKREEEKKYQALHDQLIEAIRREYITPNGRILSDTQTACALALAFHVVPEGQRGAVVASLVQNLTLHQNHLTTGFTGTQFLCPVLSENGQHALAGKVFLKEDCPSWLYPIVQHDATTVWELWDGVNPDGSVNPFEMNSLDQCALGSIGRWMIRDLLGISPLLPGFRKIRIAPRLVLGITSVSGTQETPYGTAGVSLVNRDGRYTARVEIPANTMALVSLPGREESLLGSGTYAFSYETKDHFMVEKYSAETTFGELLKSPAASEVLTKYAPDLLANEMFRNFAEARTLEEVSGMLPKEAVQLVQAAVEAANAAEQSAT